MRNRNLFTKVITDLTNKRKDILKDILPIIILDNLEKIKGGEEEKEIYEDENIEYVKRFRLIPFKSLGEENGMLVGFKVDKIEIKEEDGLKIIRNAIVGIYEKKLSKKNQYSALIGLELLEEGSDIKNELLSDRDKYRTIMANYGVDIDAEGL